MGGRIAAMGLLAGTMIVGGCVSSPGVNGPDALYRLPAGLDTRWASAENWPGAKGAGGQENAGRKGSPCFRLEPKATKVLAEVTGTSGTVRRIWVTISDRSPAMLRGLRLDMFWDGAATPAVSAPLGDFFCNGLGRMATFENALFASPEGRSFNCYIPMPFRRGMKIVVTNETDIALPMFFYDVDYTLGDRHGEDMLYFHACFQRQMPTTMQQDFELLPKVVGCGRFLGVNFSVIPDQSRYFTAWWGEGEVKMYIDGDTALPTLCGTGTEDYIGTGWGQGQYACLYQGCPIADEKKFQYAFYRLHVPDPVYFRHDIRVTIQQLGCWSPDTKPLMQAKGEPVYRGGPGRVALDFSEQGKLGDYGLFERQDDWASCAYFYLDKAENGLPPLAPVAERTAGLAE